MSRVQTELNLPRETLVGLAILLGCDYIPKGIPGVGKEQTLRLIQSLKGQTLLQRFSQWWSEGGGVLEPAVKKVTHCNVCRHPEHYVFPEEQPLEFQGEVRTVEEEAVFRLAYPEVVAHYLREKAQAEENKTKKKKPRSTKGKSAEPCDGVSDLMAQMSLTRSTEDIHPTPAMASAPSTNPSTGQPEVVADEPPAPPKPSLISGESHPQSTNCRTEGENVLAPLSPASYGKLTEMETAKSTSVSMVIDALQLSDIDWEALSFTSSPPQQSASACTTDREPVASSHNSFKKGKLDTKQRLSTFLKPKQESPEPCYSECSLRDRLLMKNTIRSINQGTEIAHNDLSKPVNLHSNPLKPNSSHSQGPKSSLQIPVKVRNDPIPSGKPHVADKTAPFVDKGQTVISKLNLAYYSSKEPSVSSTQAPSREKLNGSHGQKPLQKYKFVKVTCPSSSGLPQRSNSEPGQDLNKKIPLTTKKSVCISLCSSSEDSDTENQWQRTQKGDRGKIKTRAKVNYLTDSLKPTSRFATSKLILGNGIFPQTCRSKAMSTDEGHQVEAAISTKPKCMSNPLIIEDNNVFVSSPASPGTFNDSDDSLVSTDSPLPLAERLRLKLK